MNPDLEKKMTESMEKVAEKMYEKNQVAKEAVYRLREKEDRIWGGRRNLKLVREVMNL